MPESFAEGLTEEIITQLGRLCVDRLGVIARSSCQRVQRADRTAREIGAAPRAHYLRRGHGADRARIACASPRSSSRRRARRSSGRNRSSGRSPTACSCSPTWRRRSSDRSRWSCCPIARRRPSTRHAEHRRASGLSQGPLPLEPAGRRRTARVPRVLRAGARRSIPQFATAHAALARATVAAAEYYVREPREALDAAEAAASRALAIDPSQSEAVTALAEVRRARDWDWDGAEDAFRRALTLNPSNEGARRLYGVFLAARGQLSQAAAMTDIACDLDPLCLVSNTGAAWVRYVAGDYADVIDRCRHTIDMAADFPAPIACSPPRTSSWATRTPASAISNRCRPFSWEPSTIAWLAHAARRQRRSRRARVEHPVPAGRHQPHALRLALSPGARPGPALGDLDTGIRAAGACLRRARSGDDAARHRAAIRRRCARTPRYGAVIERLGLDRESAGHV